MSFIRTHIVQATYRNRTREAGYTWFLFVTDVPPSRRYRRSHCTWSLDHLLPVQIITGEAAQGRGGTQRRRQVRWCHSGVTELGRTPELAAAFPLPHDTSL